MRKKVTVIINIYCAFRCFWAVIWRCLWVILGCKFGTLNQHSINRIAKGGAIKILKLTKTKYNIAYSCPIPIDSNIPYIFMSNHQSLMDIPLIGATVMGSIRLIAKQELFHIPIFGKALSLSKCVPIDRKNPLCIVDVLQKCKENSNNKMMLWIFPEGTRSKTGELLAFKNGAFRLACELSAKIVPVGITNTNLVLPSGKLTVGFKQTVQIRIGTPIDTCEYKNLAQQQMLVNEVHQAIDQLIH